MRHIFNASAFVASRPLLLGQNTCVATPMLIPGTVFPPGTGAPITMQGLAFPPMLFPGAPAAAAPMQSATVPPVAGALWLN